MNRKLIESKTAPLPGENGKRMTVQVMDEVIILNLFIDKKLKCRYAMDKGKEVYATLEQGKWRKKRLRTVASENEYYACTRDVNDYTVDTEEQRQLLLGFCSEQSNNTLEAFYEITTMEDDINWDRQERARIRKVLRLEKLVAEIPLVPKDCKDWLKQEVFKEEYMFYNPEKDYYECTACGKKHHFKGKKKHNEKMVCRRTNVMTEIKKRNIRQRERTENVTVIQKIPGQDKMVTKVLKAVCEWNGCKKEIHLYSEILMVKEKDVFKTQILYGQCYRREEEQQSYWTTNQLNKRFQYNNLYIGHLKEDVKGTCFEAAGYILEEMQKRFWQINYSVVVDQYSWIGKLEYLVKAGLEGIVKDILIRYEYWNYGYTSDYKRYCMSAKTVDKFLRINMQRVHRLKQNKGGVAFLEWLQWEEKNKKAIKDTVISFMDKHRIYPNDYKFIQDKMTVEKFANYLRKQWGKEHYQTEHMTVDNVLGDWKDYLNMSEQLEYNMEDQIVYKPTDLALRHAQRVQQLLERDLKKICEELKQKYKGVEPFIQECKKKYEYRGECYEVIIPETIMDIQIDGAYLKHCVATTERYYDRMNKKETFIGFVRRVNNPELPFYTLEIEPGGNIRQQRTFYNRQTGLEEIKGFLTEYQKEIKKRLSKEDIELAKRSTRLHFANLKKLKASPVQRDKDLAAILETDYMEAV